MRLSRGREKKVGVALNGESMRAAEADVAVSNRSDVSQVSMAAPFADSNRYSVKTFRR